MDPLSQAVLASVASQQLAKPKALVAATLLGFFSGMAPDLDVLIRSDVDPLLSLEFHRQFTHSLFFIPVGGFLCALFFFFVFHRWIKKADLSFREVLMYCMVGYATHGLLDACTTYGTQLFWPLTDERVAWNTISIIDPLFTLPLLLCIVIAACYRSRKWALGALCWVVVYSLFGVVQRERAESFAQQLAEQRGHQPLILSAKPSFANLWVWKIVYTTDTHFYVDAVRTGWDFTFYEGESIEKLDLNREFPWLDADSQQAKDIERFRWFSNGYIAKSPEHPNRIIDIRYSLLPNEIKGLWGIELSPQATKTDHIRYVVNRTRDEQTVNRLWSMILGE